MFAQHSVTLAHPSDKVAALVAAPSHPWSIGLDGDGRELLAKVGVVSESGGCQFTNTSN